MQDDTPKPIYTLWQLILYLLLTFALSWAALLTASSLTPDDPSTGLIILGAFGPFVAAIIVIWTGQGRQALKDWLRALFRLRVSVWLYLLGAFVLILAMALLQFGLYRVFGGRPAWDDAESPFMYLLYLIPTALLTGGNEEPGWRGFALPALRQWFSPVLAALILGVIHGAWHLPLMGNYDTNFAIYLFNIVPLTVILNWFSHRCRGAIIPVMLLHASTNVIYRFVPMPEVVLGAVGTGLFMRGVVYWLAAILIVVVTKGMVGETVEGEA